MSLFGPNVSQNSPLPIVIDEFGAGHNDDCGPNANEMLTAYFHNRVPTYASMDAIRTRDIANGWFISGGGQGIQDITRDMNRYSPDVSTLVGPYNPSGIDAGTFRAQLRTLNGIAQQGKRPGMIVNVAYGGLLPFGQPKVTGHYVVIFGYDPASDMVLMGNGDREPLPKGTGKPDWVSVNSMMPAKIKGTILAWTSQTSTVFPIAGTSGAPNTNAGNILGIDLSWLQPARIAKLLAGIMLILVSVGAIFINSPMGKVVRAAAVV